MSQDFQVCRYQTRDAWGRATNILTSSCPFPHYQSHPRPTVAVVVSVHSALVRLVQRAVLGQVPQSVSVLLLLYRDGWMADREVLCDVEPLAAENFLFNLTI